MTSPVSSPTSSGQGNASSGVLEKKAQGAASSSTDVAAAPSAAAAPSGGSSKSDSKDYYGAYGQEQDFYDYNTGGDHDYNYDYHGQAGAGAAGPAHDQQHDEAYDPNYDYSQDYSNSNVASSTSYHDYNNYYPPTSASGEHNYYAIPIAMEPYAILEEASQKISYNTDWAGREIRKQMAQCRVRLQEHVIHRRRQVSDADTDSEDDENEAFYDYRQHLNQHLQEAWTKKQQEQLEKDLVPVFEFLDSFHLVGQQLEFIASQVSQTSMALAENVTNWCAAEYGWTKHVQTLNMKSSDLRHKQAIAQANNNRVKQQMLLIGEEQKPSWFSRKGKSLEKLAEDQHRHQQAIADFEEQQESLETVKSKLIPQVHEDLEKKRKEILQAVDDLFLKANFVVGYKTDPKEFRKTTLGEDKTAAGGSAGTAGFSADELGPPLSSKQSLSASDEKGMNVKQASKVTPVDNVRMADEVAVPAEHHAENENDVSSKEQTSRKDVDGSANKGGKPPGSTSMLKGFGKGKPEAPPSSFHPSAGAADAESAKRPVAFPSRTGPAAEADKPAAPPVAAAANVETPKRPGAPPPTTEKEISKEEGVSETTSVTPSVAATVSTSTAATSAVVYEPPAPPPPAPAAVAQETKSTSEEEIVVAEPERGSAAGGQDQLPGAVVTEATTGKKASKGKKKKGKNGGSAASSSSSSRILEAANNPLA
ncbi:unnamed protein product [Amoebophrya sp. A120]|nr:unnamed protein product [Amoebophrya sp. A120]|eukprot:GSA120T00011849001.1